MPPKMTQAQRRQETKRKILEATLQILVKKGHAGFTTAEVARTAGVSRGAQENYFRTKDSLVAAAARHALMRAADHAKRLSERALRSPAPIDQFLKDSETFFFSKEFLALIELVVAARTNPRLAAVNTPIVHRFRKLLNDLWRAVLIDAGYSRVRADRFIKLTHYMLRGMVLTSMWQPRTSEYRILLKEWRRLSVALLGPPKKRSRH